MELKINSIRWKERFPNAGIAVEKAYAEIEKIKQASGGQVSPDAIVEAAKNKRNVLHKLFTWDDDVAAAKYRMTQASALLRAIEITYTELPEQPRRAYEVATQKQRGNSEQRTYYTTAEEAAKDPANHAALIAEAVRLLMAWRARFRYLQELGHLCEEIDRTIESLVK